MYGLVPEQVQIVVWQLRMTPDKHPELQHPQARLRNLRRFLGALWAGDKAEGQQALQLPPTWLPQELL